MSGDDSGAAAALTLQRGGEELLLSKVADRFTTQLTTPDALTPLQARFNPLAVRPVARGQLVEWTVEPQRLEACLQQARAQPTVKFASHVYQLTASPHTWIYLTDQITVQFTPRLTPTQGTAIAQQYGLEETRALAGIPNTFVCAVTAQATENPIKIANRLMTHREVLTAEPNVVVETTALYRPRDALYTQQWHLNSTRGSSVNANAHIGVEQAWDVTRGSRSVVIAVSDDGFDLAHPDLQGMGKVVAPQDLKAKDAVPLPTAAVDNHGTACAGLAIGEENQSGIVGVAPGCSFMPIRTTGFLDNESIEAIFLGAMEKGAAVISCSWSPAAINFPLSLFQRNILTQAATQGRGGKGCVIVFSAGNANRPVSGTIDEKGWPRNAVNGRTEWLSGFAVHPDVITVSACTSLNRKAAYSNWGKHVAVAAPSNNAPPNMGLSKIGTVNTGPEIKSSLPGRGMVTSDRTGTAGYDQDAYTTTFGGTSSSCPVVAGVAGLMLSANPNLTAREVKQILQQTADKIIDDTPDPQLGLRHGTYDNNGHSQWFGYGRVNAHKAVMEAKRRLWQGRVYTDTAELSEDTPAPIPDNTPEGVTRSLQFRNRGTVQDLLVKVELEHAFLGDVMLHLQLPSGKLLLLQGRTLGNRQKLDQQYDLSNTPLLIEAIGEDAAGTWRLQVSDRAPGHTGQLLSWQLKLALKSDG
ncbi:MAG: S8 family serine peptidase [Leptolyngbya sp. SIO1E4]|nr:S8 family serine peptidase [Leptolyngbya sp. SIO1E4]